MMQELQAWTNGSLMGRVLRDAKRNTMTFVYDDSWWDEAQSFPLSLSMPLSATEHGNSQITPFLWGLLPDNNAVLRRWGERFNVSPSNVFRLLEHVGEDCAGAVQFVTPERVDSWMTASGQSKVEWLSTEEIADRLRLLLRDHSASRTGADRGHFSLAGAQPKTALHYDITLNRWGVPSGQIPTTHIFKPPTGDFDGYAENEHFCLALARSLGMPTASAELMNFGGVPVVVSARYDRIRHEHRVLRIHQEDTCQALAKLPERKYQNEGGPSAVDIMGLIRQHSAARAEDEARFVDALIFNWLIMGTDAHAKNYSMMLGSGGRVRLAPLYDLSSALPYPQQVYPRHATLARTVGGKYKLREIALREWKKCAQELRYDEARLVDRIREMGVKMPDLAPVIQREQQDKGSTHDMAQRLTKALQKRCDECMKLVV